ncbi:MAG: flagellar assembly protein FliW [candidate division Zixibacteria bacterium]|nr:flagellar assembly protein FliW [candidate division Zixibacteria bacterium]
MVFNSTRLGQFEVPTDKIITMARPILGFEKLAEFCLVEVEAVAPFLWLQSTEDPTVAFLVVNPLVFFPDYRIEINSPEIAELNVSRVDEVETYVIATVPEDFRKMSINLQGPILVNTANRLAKQLVLVNSDYQVKHYVMTAAGIATPTETEKELVGV